MHGTAQGLRDVGMYGVFAYRQWLNCAESSSARAGSGAKKQRTRLSVHHGMTPSFRSEHPTEWSSEHVHADLWRPSTLLARSVALLDGDWLHNRLGTAEPPAAPVF